MGIGGIGINAVQGASHAGASNIIAVDPVAFKREKAQELGATHAVDSMEEATELAKQFTNGQGADQAIITVGVIKPEHVGQAMASIRKAGTVVVTALGNIADTPLPVSLADVTLFQKRIQGALFGASNPNWDILRQLELYRSGVLKLDELITKSYSLDEIQQGYQDMHDGKNQKGVVVSARHLALGERVALKFLTKAAHVVAANDSGESTLLRSAGGHGPEVVFVEATPVTPARLIGQFDPSQVPPRVPDRALRRRSAITAMRGARWRLRLSAAGRLLYMEEPTGSPRRPSPPHHRAHRGEIAVPRRAR